jgi:endonuclease YncB( thermonuclease family)
VTEIVDGRTVIIEPQTGIRIKLELEHIEVPESEQKLHQIVKDHLNKLVLNKFVQFRTKSFSGENSIGQIFLNGIDISQQMIRDGAAWYSVASKNGQTRYQIEEYQLIETQARAEKRGVWSIPGMKPAWEFRAHKERRRLAEMKRKQEEEIEESRTQNNNPTSEKRIRSNPAGQIWVDINSVEFGLDPNIINSYKDTVGSTQPFSGYSSTTRRKYIGTPFSVLNVSFENKEHKLFGMLVYYYHDANSNTPENYYVFGLISKSPAPKFTDAKILTVVADGQTFRSIGESRKVKKTAGGVEEILSYKFSPQVLTRIKNAGKLEVELGNYRGTVPGSFLKKIQTLLKNLS